MCPSPPFRGGALRIKDKQKEAEGSEGLGGAPPPACSSCLVVSEPAELHGVKLLRVEREKPWHQGDGNTDK